LLNWLARCPLLSFPPFLWFLLLGSRYSPPFFLLSTPPVLRGRSAPFFPLFTLPGPFFFFLFLEEPPLSGRGLLGGTQGRFFASRALFPIPGFGGSLRVLPARPLFFSGGQSTCSSFCREYVLRQNGSPFFPFR